MSASALAMTSARVSGAGEMKASALVTMGDGAETTASRRVRLARVRDVTAALRGGVVDTGSTATSSSLLLQKSKLIWDIGISLLGTNMVSG